MPDLCEWVCVFVCRERDSMPISIHILTISIQQEVNYTLLQWQILSDYRYHHFRWCKDFIRRHRNTQSVCKDKYASGMVKIVGWVGSDVDCDDNKIVALHENAEYCILLHEHAHERERRLNVHSICRILMHSMQLNRMQWRKCQPFNTIVFMQYSIPSHNSFEHKRAFSWSQFTLHFEFRIGTLWTHIKEPNRLKNFFSLPKQFS